MKVLKDEIRNAIIKASEEEFAQKGFKDASMRTIAAKATISPSNIYNYFKSKDDIFREILKPLVSEIYQIMYKSHSEKHISLGRMMSKEHQIEMTETYLELTSKYKDEFRLLLFQSQGSSLEDFKTEFTNYATATVNTYFDEIKMKYPDIHFQTSDFFIHINASWIVGIIGEIVTHDLPPDKIREFFHEYITYSTAGWKELIGI